MLLGSLIFIAILGVSGCNSYLPGTVSTATSLPEDEPLILNTDSPLKEKLPSLTPPVILPTNFPVYLSSDPLPEAALSHLSVRDNVEWVANEEAADYSLKIIQETNDHDQQTVIQWVYAIAAAFPTIQDEISLRQVIDCWRGIDCDGFRLLVSEETQAIFTVLWGIADPKSVLVVPAEQLLEKAWQERDLRAILPFEQLEPRWKVLRVDNNSPLDQNFSINDYALTIQWGWQANSNKPFDGFGEPQEVVTNRLAEKFTSLILTGTTALVRQTAEKMELNGLDYPLKDIGDWLRGADITHVSNEVSFYENCPPAVPVRGGQRFCASPQYLELFKLAGVDVVELTGNHLLDWGSEPFLFTLDLYDQNGFLYYGGGRNLEEARRPLLIRHNGNRLAIIGCNRAGPENIWATDDQPGPAPCDMKVLEEEIKKAVNDGYLPIVTFQHYEVEDFMPMNLTLQEFEQTAQMGAVIVSGSQAHFAHGFGFYQNRFLHYGLGNLFFDQMFPLHRRQFIDRHIFYDGKYLGVELLTAILEDYARPRPTTQEERAEMLEDYFRVSGWLETEKP